MNRLFGTDGIRGMADKFPLDLKTVSLLGLSLAKRFEEKLGRKARFVTGRDTRESGERLETALHRGAIYGGADIESAGIVTTPGVAFLTREFEFDAGIVISASHNPFDDNGIKIFLPSGQKIDDNTERLIELDIKRADNVEVPNITATNERSAFFHETYLEHLATTFRDLDLKGILIAVDCANGAACEFAPLLFRTLGADVEAIHNRPDGRNINLESGSLHLESVRRLVIESGSALGVAFDGDADRSLFIDELGNIVDGDAVLWILGCLFKEQGGLASNKIIATVMSNIGLEIALAAKGIKLVRTAVGDKFVLEELLKSGCELGGEQSGHIIIPEQSLVGDGIVTALFLLKAMVVGSRKLSELATGFVKYPQVLINVKVKDKRPFDSVGEVAELSGEIESELNGNGRLLLRYSGTENLARVMIEGRDQTSIEVQARRLADAISDRLG